MSEIHTPTGSWRPHVTPADFGDPRPGLDQNPSFEVMGYMDNGLCYDAVTGEEYNPLQP